MGRLKFILLIMMTTGAFDLYAQSFYPRPKTLNKYEQIVATFFNNMEYPEPLKEQNLATFSLLLVNLNDKGKVVDVRFSDSAHLSFIVNFVKNYNEIDFSVFENYIKTKNITGRKLAIPFLFEEIVHTNGKRGDHPQLLKSQMEKLFYLNGESIAENLHTLPQVKIKLEHFIHNSF